MTGWEMWREYKVTYGIKYATEICQAYLDMQIEQRSDDAEEMKFCRDLNHAMEGDGMAYYQRYKRGEVK